MALVTMGRSVCERGAGKGCLYGGWGEQGGLGSVVAMERWVLCECICVDGDGEAGSFDTLNKNKAHFFLVSQGNGPGVEILLYLQNGRSNEHLLNS